MSYKKWYIGLTVLLLVFIYLFIQLFIASYKIQSSVQKINHTDTMLSRHVILITQELDNPYWKTIEQGAATAAKKYNMNLEYIGPVQINLNEQLDYFDKAIAAKADAIIVQGATDPRFVSLMNKANVQGIPVITVDTDSPDASKLTYVGTDNFASGKKLGELVVQAVKGNGKIGVIIGSNSAENQRQRLEGLLSLVKKYPNIQVVGIQSSDISQIKAAQQAEKMIKMNPDIDVIVGTSVLDGVGIAQTVKSLKKQRIKIFGFDDLPETIKAIKEREIQATIQQQPYMMGFNSIELLEQFFKKQTVPREKFTKIHVLNRGNVH
jgi:ribose transport system substrate-binding protein